MIADALQKVRDDLKNAGLEVLIEPLTVYTTNITGPKVYVWPNSMAFHEASLDGSMVYTLEIQMGVLYPTANGGDAVGLAALGKVDTLLKLFVDSLDPATADEEFSPADWEVEWATAPGALIARVTGQMYVDISLS